MIGVSMFDLREYGDRIRKLAARIARRQGNNDIAEEIDNMPIPAFINYNDDLIGAMNQIPFAQLFECTKNEEARKAVAISLHRLTGKEMNDIYKFLYEWMNEHLSSGDH